MSIAKQGVISIEITRVTNGYIVREGGGAAMTSCLVHVTETNTSLDCLVNDLLNKVKV